jgi:outer membrane protein
MKKIFLSTGFLILYLAVVPPFLFGENYSLNDLCRIALDRSEKIKISEDNINIAATGKNKALAALIPKASTYGTYTQYTGNKRSDTGSVIQPNDAATWGLRLDQSFSLSGREFTALDVAGENVEKSRFDLLSLKEDYIVTIASSFYDVLKTKKALEIADANMERLTSYRNAANTRLRVGEATKTALLRAEGELSGAQSEKTRAANNLEAAKVSLARIAGIEGIYDIKENTEEDILSFSLAELQNTALGRRAEIKALEALKRIAGKQVSYAKGSFWPNLSLAAVYAMADQDPPSSSMNRDSIYGSVALNFPFYEGGLRKAEVIEAEIKLRQAELILADAIKSITLEVKQAYLDYTTQQGIIKFLQDQLVYARDNYNAVSKQYEFGLANSIDVIDANNLLLSSQRQLADALYNARFAMLKIKRATGGLSADILGVKK